ncbi:MAG: OpgC domain-containing protein [Pseudomonadota bacterium]
MTQTPANLELPKTAKRRDPRLDFFRGIAMFIIFMAHMPGNWFTLYIPARFGFSDATEIFVFCSGMASAIAFGKIFSDISWLMGAARIVHRMWQVYWAHIGLFFVTVLLMVIQTRIAASGALCEYNPQMLCNNEQTEPWNYLGRLNVIHLFQPIDGSPGWDNFLGIMTLTWVPNLFDILPMYIVVLSMIPIVMALGKVSKYAVFAFMAVMWFGAQLDLLWLPAEPWSDREWFFNPFGWQLVFFTGFAFMMGWIPAPPVNMWLMALCIAFVVFTIPFAFWGIYRNPDNFVLSLEASRWLMGVDDLGTLLHDGSSLKRDNLEPFNVFQLARENYWILMAKTDFGVLRYLHFLALAYIFWALSGEGGKNLDFKNTIGAYFVKVVHKVGQQSLGIFMTSIVLSRLAGFILDIIGSTWATMVLVNGVGFAILIAVA